MMLDRIIKHTHYGASLFQFILCRLNAIRPQRENNRTHCNNSIWLTVSKLQAHPFLSHVIPSVLECHLWKISKYFTQQATICASSSLSHLSNKSEIFMFWWPLVGLLKHTKKFFEISESWMHFNSVFNEILDLTQNNNDFSCHLTKLEIKSEKQIFSIDHKWF